jgi:hypothetical protein
LDPKTKVLFYAESDGRHVAAIDSEGKVLWHRDIINDNNLKNARGQPGTVWSLGALGPRFQNSLAQREYKGDHIGVGFHGGISEAGALNQRTAEYVYMGGY